VRWIYLKDGSVSEGDDAGYVDQVAFVELTEPRILADPSPVELHGDGTAVPAASLTLTNAGPGQYTFDLIPSQSWLTVDPAHGIVAATPVVIQVSAPSLTASNGVFNASLSVTAPEADNSPLTIPVRVTVSIPVDLDVALDVPGLPLVTGGHAAWAGQMNESHDGADAAQSGDVDDYGDTWMNCDVEGPADVFFWWRVSSETGYDYLRFLVDGTDAATPLSGETGWQQVSIELASGPHTLEWRYEKDFSVSGGSDCGWVDELVIAREPAYPPCALEMHETPAGLEIVWSESNTVPVVIRLEQTEDLASGPWTSVPDAVQTVTTDRATFRIPHGPAPRCYYRARSAPAP
jgi:hypothetical protein